MHVTLKGIPFTHLATTLSFYSHSVAKTVCFATLTYTKKRAGIQYNVSIVCLLYIGILICIEATMKKVKHVKLRILEVILINLPHCTANINMITEEISYFMDFSYILHVFTL